MIICKECGCTYNEVQTRCPECGNPTEISLGTDPKKLCPNCGAEGQKVQGYNFVCEFCGTQFPVDAQTRAMIDAEQHQEFMAQQKVINEAANKQNKKVLLIIAIVAISVISILIGTSLYSSHKKEREIAEAHAAYERIVEDIKQGKDQSAYVSPNDIFITDNPDRIGHLNQNLISILKQKGFVEDGALTYSYYINGTKKMPGNPRDNYFRYGYNTSLPLIKIEINSYDPLIGKSNRKNESDAVHSIAITINNDDLRKIYENIFRKDLRNIGFNVENNSDYNSFIEMSNFELIRIGNTIKNTQYFITHITANWEGVRFKDINERIECVGFCEFDGKASENNVVTDADTTAQSSATVNNTNDEAAVAIDAATDAALDAAKK